ncbi:MAG: imidazole glycerol phosphate synthase subunit HisH [Chitinophagales bacterium]
MEVAIINYNAGNIHSVELALMRLGIKPILTNDPEILLKADKIIFPGVGEASSAMQSLKRSKLNKLIPELKQPFLGICLGLQLLCKSSEEGNTKCLGVFPIRVLKMQNKPLAQLKIPHMGWNNISNIKGVLFEGISPSDYFYFVHSYYAQFSEYTSATCTYNNLFSAALSMDNFHAVQFHPEKSSIVGERLLKNFIEKT